MIVSHKGASEQYKDEFSEPAARKLKWNEDAKGNVQVIVHDIPTPLETDRGGEYSPRSLLKHETTIFCMDSRAKYDLESEVSVFLLFGVHYSKKPWSRLLWEFYKAYTTFDSDFLDVFSSSHFVFIILLYPAQTIFGTFTLLLYSILDTIFIFVFFTATFINYFIISFTTFATNKEQVSIVAYKAFKEDHPDETAQMLYSRSHVTAQLKYILVYCVWISLLYQSTAGQENLSTREKSAASILILIIHSLNCILYVTTLKFNDHLDYKERKEISSRGGILNNGNVFLRQVMERQYELIQSHQTSKYTYCFIFMAILFSPFIVLISLFTYVLPLLILEFPSKRFQPMPNHDDTNPVQEYLLYREMRFLGETILCVNILFYFAAQFVISNDPWETAGEFLTTFIILCFALSAEIVGFIYHGIPDESSMIE